MMDGQVTILSHTNEVILTSQLNFKVYFQKMMVLAKAHAFNATKSAVVLAT